MTTTLDLTIIYEQRGCLDPDPALEHRAKKEVVLEAAIEDENGYPAATFIRAPYPLLREHTRNISWNTGSTIAGSYRSMPCLKMPRRDAEKVVPSPSQPMPIVDTTM